MFLRVTQQWRLIIILLRIQFHIREIWLTVEEKADSSWGKTQQHKKSRAVSKWQRTAAVSELGPQICVIYEKGGKTLWIMSWPTWFMVTRPTCESKAVGVPCVCLWPRIYQNNRSLNLRVETKSASNSTRSLFLTKLLHIKGIYVLLKLFWFCIIWNYNCSIIVCLLF